MPTNPNHRQTTIRLIGQTRPHPTRESSRLGPARRLLLQLPVTTDAGRVLVRPTHGRVDVYCPVDPARSVCGIRDHLLHAHKTRVRRRNAWITTVTAARAPARLHIVSARHSHDICTELYMLMITYPDLLDMQVILVHLQRVDAGRSGREVPVCPGAICVCTGPGP